MRVKAQSEPTEDINSLTQKPVSKPTTGHQTQRQLLEPRLTYSINNCSVCVNHMDCKDVQTLSCEVRTNIDG